MVLRVNEKNVEAVRSSVGNGRTQLTFLTLLAETGGSSALRNAAVSTLRSVMQAACQDSFGGDSENHPRYVYSRSGEQ